MFGRLCSSLGREVCRGRAPSLAACSFPQGLAVALVHPRAIATSSSAFLSRQSFQRQNKPSPRPIEESFVDEISGSILSDSERDGKTIFALSSAPGRAGVSILRISGPHASDVFGKIMEPSSLPRPRVIVNRVISDPTSQEELDRALVVYFKGPHSFTGEDVVELHVHGSLAVISAVTRTLTSIGFTLAEPGEFSRRAFYNGKMDLTAVEGLADLISAETEQQRKQAMFHMSGQVGDLYRGWSETLASALARIEALIDFGEDEQIDMEIGKNILPPIQSLRNEIAIHLSQSERGTMIRRGVQIAIIGPPNAGKSSLLNTLAQRPAAIVSPIAGTTRDVVEVHLDLGGYPVIVADTAGLLEHTQDEIEREGITRARERFAQAEVRVVVFDVKSSALLDTSTLQEIRALSEDTRRNIIVVLNKADLANSDEMRLAMTHAAQALGIEASQILSLSCQTSAGVAELVAEVQRRIEAIVHRSSSGISQSQAALITRARHKQHLEETFGCLERFIERPYRMEIAAEELRDALQSIGRITGKVDVEGLLDRIFREFCIGK